MDPDLVKYYGSKHCLNPGFYHVMNIIKKSDIPKSWREEGFRWKLISLQTELRR